MQNEKSGLEVSIHRIVIVYESTLNQPVETALIFEFLISNKL